MNKRVTFTTLLLLSHFVCYGALNAWINEFHYDNVSTDTGEFIEVVAPSDFTDLANLTVTLFNGEVGSAAVSYDSLAVSTFATVGSSGNSFFSVYYIALPSNGIQNGSRDGFGLSYSGMVIQLLSYEGIFTVASGQGEFSGLTSTDIGVSESGTTPSGSSIGLTGTGSSYSSFTWDTFSDASPGTFNPGQSAVPEPSDWAAICGAGLLGLCGLRVWRRRRNTLPVTAAA